MKKLQSTARHLALLLLLSACTLIGCTKDDGLAAVPDNWITIDDSIFSATYEGAELSRQFTIPAGLNPDYLYVVSQANWVRASIENGSELLVRISASSVTEVRTTYISIFYDPDHSVDIDIEQGASPAAMVSDIVLDSSLNNLTIGVGQKTDLTPLIEVRPANAGNKSVEYSSSSPEVAVVEDNILRGLAVGSTTITVTAADGGGVSASFNVKVEDMPFDRTGWTVTTSIQYDDGLNYCPDGTTGKPEDMFDGAGNTYLSLVKPGKNNGTYVTPANHQLYFIVDMGAEQTFNYVIWGHRTSNTYARLRVWKCTFLGSDDGQNFTPITDIDGFNKTDGEPLTQTFALPETTCRYVKVEIKEWDDTNGASVQIAEFSLGLTSEPIAPPALVSDIVLDPSLSNGLSIAVGQEKNLASLIEIQPADAINKTVTWSSSDTGVATVEGGVLKALTIGKTTITVTAADEGGATASFDVTVKDILLDRAGWTATTSITYNDNGQNYCPDGTTGKPEDMFDGLGTTYLSLVKPGKTLNSCTTPADHQLYFIVDMGSKQTFNYLVWGHRSNHAYDWLRVWKCSLYGSDDGDAFTPIQSEIQTHTAVANYTEEFDLPETTCRYIKVVYDEWNTGSGSSIQVAEFSLGYK